MNYTYRLAVSQQVSPHSYEIGYWPDGADMTNPNSFVVVENAWGQVEAAQRASLYVTGIVQPSGASHG